jgi:malate synthase
MWAMPDLMAAMLQQKIAHPASRRQHRLGAQPHGRHAARHALPPGRWCSDVQKEMEKIDADGRTRCFAERLADKCPVVAKPNWSDAENKQELDNNAQGILGYVVRWIDQGVGCSKVPDIHNVGLMEDRATLRISSQHMANWLHHGVVHQGPGESHLQAHGRSGGQAERGRPVCTKPWPATLQGLAAYQAACDLVFKGKEQPSGYTEPLLHAWRLKVKAGTA